MSSVRSETPAHRGTPGVGSRVSATSGLRADHNCYVPKINMAWVALGAAVLALLGPLPAPGPADPHVARFAVARGWPPVVPGPPIESTAMPPDGYSRRCTDSSNAWLG